MKQLLWLFLLLPLGANAQFYLGLGAHLGGLSRGGEWAKIHGNAFTSGGRIEIGLNSGWTVAAEGEILFSNDVKIDPIAGLRSDVGVIFGDIMDEARPADIPLRSRAYRASVMAGYQYTFNDRGFGVRGLVGPSYTSHFIRIQDDPNQTTSNLRDEYKIGYDRRAAGWGAVGEAGVQYAQPSGTFYLYAVVTGAFTSSEPLRNTQFDVLDAAPQAGTDTSIGAKVGLVLALWRDLSRERAEDIYY